MSLFKSPIYLPRVWSMRKFKYNYTFYINANVMLTLQVNTIYLEIQSPRWSNFYITVLFFQRNVYSLKLPVWIASRQMTSIIARLSTLGCNNLKMAKWRITHLVPVTHHVMYCDKCFEDHRPVCVLRPFDEQIRQLWNRHIWLVRAVN